MMEALLAAVFNVTLNVCTPASVAVYVWGLSVAACTVPEYPVATFPNWSFAVTVYDWVTPAVVEVGPLTTNVVATSAIAVAVNVLGDPVRPAPVAVYVYPPEVFPTLAVIDALPSGPVFVEPDETWPPPVLALQVTVKFGTALPLVSKTLTTSVCASAVPTTAVWASPETTTIEPA